MQKAIERVECGDEERKNSKSNPRYDDLLKRRFFVEPLHPQPGNQPRSIILFPLKSNLTPHPSYARGHRSIMP